MSSTRVARLEKALVLLLAASFAVPGLLGLCLRLSVTKTRAPAMLRNRTLGGIQLKPELIAPTPTTLLSARCQGALALFYNVNFTGREVAIRVLDEAYLRLFRSSPNDNIIGRHFSIFEPLYAEEYCLQRGDDAALRAFISDLRRMQDFCRARGIAFAVLVTPSKAAIYPEDLPEKWLRRHRPEPRYYELFVPLLKEAGIQYVDGHRLALEMKPAATVPLFPEGGTHWGQPLALAATNALLELLARQGLDVRPITDYQTRFSTDPMGEDADLATLLNPLFPRRYPVTTLSVQPMTADGAARPNLVTVGGSFAGKPLELLNASRQFSELEHYVYYKGAKNTLVDGEWHVVANPARPMDFETDIFAADALVLEVNEQTLPAPAPHLTSFLHDAFAVLPDPRSAKAPFHYESHVEYRWGDTLLFLSDHPTVNPAAVNGFDVPLSKGANSLGAVSSVQLIVTPAPGDMVLEVTAGAFHLDKGTPEQTVAVSVNGHPAGTWKWTSVADSRRRLTVPAEWLQGGKLRVEFRPAHLVSPADLGVNSDPRKMGFRLSSLRMYREKSSR